MKKIILIVATAITSIVFVNPVLANPHSKNTQYSLVRSTQEVDIKTPKIKKIKYTKVIVKETTKPVAPTIQYDETSPSGYFAAEKERQQASKKQIVSVERKVVQRELTIYNNSVDLVSKASSYMGATASQLGLPRSLWCADFMNMLVGGDDRRAISYLHRGAPAQHGCVNCIAVTTRKGGNHVGVVLGYDEDGNPIIISGNHNRRVGVATYVKRKVIAYRYI